MFERTPKPFGSHGENWISYRESEKFKNAVTALEELEGLTNSDKISILATALDLKPAGMIHFFKKVEESHITQILSDLGLFFMPYENEAKANPDLVEYIIGNSPENIAEVQEALPVLEHDESFGAAMGYPTTAIAAYGSYVKTGDASEVLPMSAYHEHLTEEERKFLFFRLSRDNYEKEIEWLEQLIAAVKLYAPHLYEDVMKQNR